MTDNDIIKALECCREFSDCDGCQYGYLRTGNGLCIYAMQKDALDLIARQKAEIEALIAGQETLQKYIAEKNAEIERLTTAYPKTIESIKKMRDKAKAEAIKEYVDRLTAELIEGGIYPAFVKGKIEKVKKEMAGDV